MTAAAHEAAAPRGSEQTTQLAYIIIIIMALIYEPQSIIIWHVSIASASALRRSTKCLRVYN